MATPATVAVPTMEQIVALATHLADEDERLLFELIKARKDAGLSQKDVADRLAIKQPSVAKFERYDSDPRLSTIRRYALAVGARVEHSVTADAFGQDWTPMPGIAPTVVVGAERRTQHAGVGLRPARTVDFGSMSDYAPAA